MIASTQNDFDHEMPKHATTATRNACKVCTPLGACLAFKGIEGALPFLHGSQGCSTYIRRYVISHFREPIDIAASNFSEDSAIFGGQENFNIGIDNVRRQYKPSLIGVATTCLSETIGEDMTLIFQNYRRVMAPLEPGETPPEMVHVSTPSYTGSHIEGFHAAINAVATQLAEGGEKTKRINLFPGMVSAEDLRHLRDILDHFGAVHTLLPDYSDTMDGPSWAEYQKLPEGGTPIADIKAMGTSQASIEFGRVLASQPSAGKTLEKKHGVFLQSLGLPIGIRETDTLFRTLEALTGNPTPTRYTKERGRLVDSMVDGHKYLFGKKAVVYGEEDLVIGLTSFLCEIGVEPVLCASGGQSRGFENALREAVPELSEACIVRNNTDFADITALTKENPPDLIVGNSKGYKTARLMDVPLVRVGFPIHDRIGGQRTLHVGYAGAQSLYDRLVNTLLERKQDDSEMGYTYI